MKNGFYILVIHGGYYPYVMAGWVQRYDFLLRVRNSRLLRQFGNGAQLSQLAKNGPMKGPNGTQLLDLSEEEWPPLASVSRPIPADPSKWPECPKPDDWVD